MGLSLPAWPANQVFTYPVQTASPALLPAPPATALLNVSPVSLHTDFPTESAFVLHLSAFSPIPPLNALSAQISTMAARIVV